MFYNFIFVNFNTIKKTNSDIVDIDTKYNTIFKKLIKISKNPIIFEYQLEQINKILPNTDKYIKYQRYICNINKSKKKNISVYKNYIKITKILLKIKILNVNEIIIKLIWINFI